VGRVMKYGMKIFGTIMIAHWLEHIFQAYQVYVLHLHRECALGLLGMKYPWLIKTESLHYVFAMWTVWAMIYAGWKYFESDWASKMWIYGTIAAVWHFIEHCLLFGQAVTHHYLFHQSQPTSIIQLFVPRIELHLFYNSIITLLAGVALLEEYLYRDATECYEDHCDCR
jgi:hypothetical protein